MYKLILFIMLCCWSAGSGANTASGKTMISAVAVAQPDLEPLDMINPFMLCGN